MWNGALQLKFYPDSSNADYSNVTLQNQNHVWSLVCVAKNPAVDPLNNLEQAPKPIRRMNLVPITLVSNAPIELSLLLCHPAWVNQLAATLQAAWTSWYNVEQAKTTIYEF